MKQFKVTYQHGLGKPFIVSAENEADAVSRALGELRRTETAMDDWGPEKVIAKVEETDGTLPENPSYPTVPPYLTAKDILTQMAEDKKAA